jgi:hypothetical protein
MRFKPPGFGGELRQECRPSGGVPAISITIRPPIELPTMSIPSNPCPAR